MDDQMNLEILAKKYESQVNDLQEQLNEAKKRYEIVISALELLQKDGHAEQKELFQPVLSDKFKGMSMPDSIKSIIETSPNQKVSSEEIVLALKKHGYQSNSDNLKSAVYTRLYRLRKKGRLMCRTERGIKKYYLPEKEGVKKEL